MLDWLNAHRGPFWLCITRPHPGKPGFYRSEWLTSEVPRDDVEDECLALLTDPRDTIRSIQVWSVPEQRYCGTIKGDSV